MADTRIEWASKVWNPVTGCTPVSRGCDHCYAARWGKRLQAMRTPGYEKGFAVTLHPDKLDEPLHWRKPARIFVCSMGDLFHEDVPPEFAWRVFNVIDECPQHTFVILTKRIIRARDIIRDMLTASSQDALPDNCCIGPSVEDQKTAEERIPVSLQIPAAVHVVSLEPMLGPVDIARFLAVRTGDLCRDLVEIAHRHQTDRLSGRGASATIRGLDWVICGGETGPSARPMHPDWVRKVRDDCAAAPLRAAVGPGVPFFFKHWGEWAPTWGGGTHLIYPDGKYVVGDHEHPDAWKRHLAEPIARLGKKRAGRMLDGRTHDEAPDGPAR